MKKLTLLLLFVATNVFAQNSFWTQTTYRGAFEPAPSPMWTTGWTNWDPQNTVYPSATDTISGEIVIHSTWTSNKVYLVQGPVYVKTFLLIQPGTVVLFDKNTPGSALIVTKAGTLLAEGTVTQPIVFTSNAAVGQRNIGDWGGLVILGEAINNLPANAASGTPAGVGYIEGLPTSANTEYGGNDDQDSSGVLKYVRIEFGGYAYQPDKEINGLTFGSVGSKTVVDYVQVSFANDDAFEWFGGTVNAKHLVSYRNLDDDFDTDFGYRGKVQFGLIVRDPYIADQSAGSTSEGFESDNDGAGTNNSPKTAATFSNITAIGPLRGNLQATIDPKFRRALRLRRNTELKVFNSLFIDFKDGIHIDGTSTEVNALQNKLLFKNNLIAGCSGKFIIRATNPSFDAGLWYFAYNDTLATATGLLISPYNYINPDFRPALNSGLDTGADFSDTNLIGSLSANEFVLQNKFYPNPVTDLLYSEIEGDLVDMTGRVVYKVNKGWNNLAILPKGIYIVENTRIIKK